MAPPSESPATETLTFLFTDIEGSTGLLERLGPEAYADLLVDHHRLIREATSQHGGREIDTQGDGFFIVFSSATACASAAIDMQAAVAGHVWRAKTGPRVRMGIHSGEAADTVTGLVGFDVHRAARVGAVAHGGQIVMSETTAVLLRDSLDRSKWLKDLGAYRLKDLSGPQQLFQLCAQGSESDFPQLRSLDHPELANNLPTQGVVRGPGS